MITPGPKKFGQLDDATSNQTGAHLLSDEETSTYYYSTARKKMARQKSESLYKSFTSNKSTKSTSETRKILLTSESAAKQKKF